MGNDETRQADDMKPKGDPSEQNGPKQLPGSGWMRILRDKEVIPVWVVAIMAVVNAIINLLSRLEDDGFGFLLFWIALAIASVVLGILLFTDTRVRPWISFFFLLVLVVVFVQYWRLDSQCAALRNVNRLQELLGPEPKDQFPWQHRKEVEAIEREFVSHGLDKVPDEGLFWLADAAFLRAQYRNALDYATRFDPTSPKGCGSHAGHFSPNRVQETPRIASDDGEEVSWPR